MPNPFLARATVILRITFLLSGKRVFAFSNLYQITFAHFWAQRNFALDALPPARVTVFINSLVIFTAQGMVPTWVRVVVVRELIARLPTPLGGGSTTYIRSIYCAPLFLRTAHDHKITVMRTREHDHKKYGCAHCSQSRLCSVLRIYHYSRNYCYFSQKNLDISQHKISANLNIS